MVKVNVNADHNLFMKSVSKVVPGGITRNAG